MLTIRKETCGCFDKNDMNPLSRGKYIYIKSRIVDNAIINDVKLNECHDRVLSSKDKLLIEDLKKIVSEGKDCVSECCPCFGNSQVKAIYERASRDGKVPRILVVDGYMKAFEFDLDGEELTMLNDLSIPANLSGLAGFRYRVVFDYIEYFGILSQREHVIVSDLLERSRRTLIFRMRHCSWLAYMIYCAPFVALFFCCCDVEGTKLKDYTADGLKIYSCCCFTGFDYTASDYLRLVPEELNNLDSQKETGLGIEMQSPIHRD